MEKIKEMALWKKLVVAIIIGITLGFVSPAGAELISPIGEIFLRLLKMLIVPLVFFSITSGICKMGDVKQLRTVGSRYILWIVFSAIIAALIGVTAALIVQPGKGTTEFLASTKAGDAVSYSFIENVINWFPTNIVEAFVKAEMVQIIVFCMFLGVALLSLRKKAKVLVDLIDQGSEAMLKITEFIMEISPIGILSLMATMVSTISGSMMKEIIVFLILDIVACLVLLVIIFPILVKLLTRLSIFKIAKKITSIVLIAISTTSSAATLPVSMKIADEELGIPENVYGFTLPLGNTCGMTGFALFVGLVCVFASNLYGFEITVGGLVQFIFLGMILSIGAAGVKGAGIVMSTVLLETLGMPLTLIPVLAAIWPIIDPAHTVLNNVGDLCGTIIVAKRLNLMDIEKYEK